MKTVSPAFHLGLLIAAIPLLLPLVHMLHTQPYSSIGEAHVLRGKV